jgi:hypothetical protein
MYVNDSDLLIIGSARPAEQAQTVEVCRSFAYKLNLANHGGPAYESADFFASRKMACAAADAEWVSNQIFEECVAEVRSAVDAFIVAMKAKIGARAASRADRRTA